MAYPVGFAYLKSEESDMISKHEALAKMTAKDEKDYAELEKACHEALEKYNGREVTVIIDGFSEKAVDRIVADYSAPTMGWTVVKHPSKGQFSEAYLSFT